MTWQAVSLDRSVVLPLFAFYLLVAIEVAFLACFLRVSVVFSCQFSICRSPLLHRPTISITWRLFANVCQLCVKYSVYLRVILQSFGEDWQNSNASPKFVCSTAFRRIIVEMVTSNSRYSTETGNNSCKACRQPTSWNSWTILYSGQSCNDGNACTYDDGCAAGGICSGATYSCNDHGTCNGDGTCTCDEGYAGDLCDSCTDLYINYPDCEPLITWKYIQETGSPWPGCFGQGCSTGDPYCDSSIHMPRWASRISLEIANVKVEHLQDITEEDTIADRPGKPHVKPEEQYLIPTRYILRRVRDGDLTAEVGSMDEYMRMQAMGGIKFGNPPEVCKMKPKCETVKTLQEIKRE